MTPSSSQKLPPVPDVTGTSWEDVDEHEVLAYDATTNTYQASINRQNESVALDVVAAVATVSNTAPMELPPLYKDIDRDAFEGLDELLGSETAMGETLVVLTYVGHEVTVDGNGVLTVRPPSMESPEER